MPIYAFEQRNKFLVKSSLYKAHMPYQYIHKCVPKIQIKIMRPTAKRKRRLPMLVDTGACISTLTASVADCLGINRIPTKCELNKPYKGPGGFPLVGVVRKLRVFLGSGYEDVDVLVPHRQQPGKPIELGPVPDKNLLGRDGLLDRYLLCFDSAYIYIFKKKRRQRTR